MSLIEATDGRFYVEERLFFLTTAPWCNRCKATTGLEPFLRPDPTSWHGHYETVVTECCGTENWKEINWFVGEMFARRRRHYPLLGQEDLPF